MHENADLKMSKNKLEKDVTDLTQDQHQLQQQLEFARKWIEIQLEKLKSSIDELPGITLMY